MPYHYHSAHFISWGEHDLVITPQNISNFKVVGPVFSRAPRKKTVRKSRTIYYGLTNLWGG
ncbi:hypothetical protein BQ8482_100185 [Mesorhizobium delmotii]|uniref:Uncharacterized protein n=1 Tax=Mesorhizobium delmotii TaxID=1631247 RepID=A0A2P9AA43_9HYPH|nr:hypothetical protein BQ8482_100185 [Mesorhizobium delmotii]